MIATKMKYEKQTQNDTGTFFENDPYISHVLYFDKTSLYIVVFCKSTLPWIASFECVRTIYYHVNSHTKGCVASNAS